MIIGIIFICLLGTLLHFLYDLSNHNKIVGLFSAVNESVWEHIKIALTPIFLWSLYDGFVFGANSNYFVAKAISIIVLMVFIPLVFYIYTTILKKHNLVIDVITFYIAIILNQIIFRYILTLNPINYIFIYLSVIVLFIIFGFYMILTIFPIENDLFKDPITKKYGIEGHHHHKH